MFMQMLRANVEFGIDFFHIVLIFSTECQRPLPLVVT